MSHPLKKIEALILTEGGAEIGLGHVARCGALFDAFSYAEVNAEIFVCGDLSVSTALSGRRWRLCDWLSALPRRIQDNIGSNNTIVFVDSYRISDSAIEKFAQAFPNFVLLDDHAVRSPSRGIVVTPVNFSEFLSISICLKIKRFVGPEYILLRRPFWNRLERRVKKRIDKVLVTLGSGSSTKAPLLQMLTAVREEYPESTITLLSGQRDGLGPIQEVQAMPKVEVRENLTPDEIFDLMYQTDIAVTSGGQTLYELACAGVPAIAISIVDNQLLSIRAFCRSGYLLDVLSGASDGLTDSLKEQLNLLRDFKTRERLSQAGQRQIDGGGALRLVKALIEGVE